MANGEALDDALLVDMFMHELRAFPEGRGWIIDNFPTTLSQAKVCTRNIIQCVCVSAIMIDIAALCGSLHPFLSKA